MHKYKWIAALLALVLAATSAHAAQFFVYFGTQDKTPGTGFSLARFDSETGALTKPVLIEPADAPSFFVIHPDGKHLYSTNFSGAGGVSAYRIDPKTGGLTLINRIPGGNSGTSFIGLDQTAHTALAANFDNGHIAAFPIKPDFSMGDHTAFDIHTGSSINPQRQGKPYPHSIFTDPTNHFALVPDLGLDKVFVYHFDEKASTLTADEPPFITVKPGNGPRHVRFHPNGQWAYLLCEMGSMVVAYHWDSIKGALAEFQTISTIPGDFTAENNAAEIEIHPSGKFLYASNRGHDSIASFSIDSGTGQLTPLAHNPTQGKAPRNFALDPTGQWLLATNQTGNSAIVFKIDQTTGKLTQTGEPVPISAPCCERFLAIP